MAGRFAILTDENTAKGIANALISDGWDVVRGIRTVEQGTDDDILLLKAVELERVLLTRDVDLEVLAHRWLREVAQAIEALAQQDDPFAYPIVYLKPRRP